jgi:serine/threonine protein phosphatase 1
MTYKRYAIGDLHGNYKALKEVLNKSQFDKEKDHLYFLGDLADGHPEPHKCLSELNSIPNMFPILGNHDLFLKQWTYTSKIDKRWTAIGGMKTVSLFVDYIDELKIYFEKARPFFIVENKILCHGGFNHKRLIVKQRNLNFSINRSMYKTSKKYRKNGLKFKIIYDELDSIKLKEIIVGHNPTKNYLPEFNANLINIDTGAGNGGKLTIMDIDTKRYYQSKKSSFFYDH